MATVNLLNNGWESQKSTSVIQVDITSERVKFRMETTANTSGYAKACIKIDTSKYSSITFQYSKRTVEGISDLCFGIWDDMIPNNVSGEIKIHSSAETKWNSSGGSITFDIPDSKGYKYVGFRFYGNETNSATTSPNGVTERIAITSLTATERGYTLFYDYNSDAGGSITVDDVRTTQITYMTPPARSGYEFLGWSTSPSATIASYVAGDSITLTSNITLYAVWRRKGQVYICDNIGESNPYQVLIYDESGWNQYIPYIYTESGWIEYSG